MHVAGCTFLAAGFGAAGSALVAAGRSGTLRALPDDLDAAGGTMAAAFLASVFAPESALAAELPCAALHLHRDHMSFQTNMAQSMF